MKKYRKILRSAYAGKLPDEIEKGTCEDFDLYFELREAGHLSGAYQSFYGGAIITRPKITLSGRTFLDELNKRRLKPIVIFLSWLSGVFSTIIAQYLFRLLVTSNY